MSNSPAAISHSGAKAGEIGGITVGVVIIVLLAILIVVVVMKKWKLKVFRRCNAIHIF